MYKAEAYICMKWGFYMQRYSKNMIFVQVLGVLGVFILGTIWHDLIDYFGQNPIIGLIAPVNESSWEHWKIALFPWLILMFLEYPSIKNQVTNYTFSKVMGLLAFQFVTFGVLFIHSKISGECNWVLNIVMYVIGITVGQFVSYFLMKNLAENKWLDTMGLFILVIELFLIFTFTINPLKTDYFKDSETGTYGIYQYKD